MWWVRERGSALRMLRMLVWTSKCVWHPQYPQWWVRLSKASKSFGVFGQYFLSPCGSRITVYLHGFQRLQTPNKLKVIRKAWALISQSSTVCRACTQPAPPHRMTQAVSKGQPRWSSHIWLSLKLATGCAQTCPPDELSSKSVRPCVVPGAEHHLQRSPERLRQLISSLQVPTGSSRLTEGKLAESQKDDLETAAKALSTHSTEPCWWHWICSLLVASEVNISLCSLMQIVGASQHKLRNVKFAIIELHWLPI